MNMRAGTGWQYLLADLSLILFMVTAAALAQSIDDPGKSGVAALSPTSEPVAFYRAGAGAPPLDEWLQSQSVDARQQLTIIAHYAPGKQAEALAQADTLSRQAGEAGTRARIVIEPGNGGTTATLAYDVPQAPVAQGLQGDGQSHSDVKERP